MFPCEFCKIFKNTFFIEHHQNVASETVTGNSLRNSAQDKTFSALAENLHIISPLYVWLGSKYVEYVEYVENKAMLKSISQC